MISSIRVKNHKCHKDTILNLCPGFNVIVGDTQAGKSAFLQGFNLFRTNRPLGLGKRSWFAKEGEPILIEVVKDGTKLSLEKSEKDSIYRVGERPFRKFAKDIPRLLVKLLNFIDLNIQWQLDPHYLILSGPAEVARAINSVTGLEDLDPALNWLTTEVNRRKADIRVLKEQLKARKENLKAYKNLDKWDRKVREGERMVKKWEETGDQKEELHSVIDEIKKAQEKIDKCVDVDMANCLDLIVKIEEGLAEAGRVKRAAKELETLVRAALQHSEEKVLANKLKLGTAKEEHDRLVKDFGKCPFCMSDLKDRVA